MLRAYVRRWRNSIRTLTNRRHLPPRSWLERAFRDFIPSDGDRAAMLAKIAGHVQRVAAQFDAFVSNGESAASIAKALVNAAASLDDGSLKHNDLGLRAYVDASLKVKILRVLADYVALLSIESITMSPLEVTAILVEHFPENQPALLAHAELLLEQQRIEEAIDFIRRALRVDSVCVASQRLLHRAYQMQRDAGVTAPEHAVLDYDLTDKFCHLPFTHFSTGFRGATFGCLCPAWLPYSMGNILEAESADAIWNSDAAQEIRRSILDGDFSYCSKTLCSFIAARKLPSRDSIDDPMLRRYIETHATKIDDVPEFVELNHDPTCNLSCPSCRTEIVAANADEQDLYERASERVILPMLRKVNGTAYISGGGEALASRHFRSILKSLNRAEYPGLRLLVISNGTLFTPSRWAEYPDLPEMTGALLISLDAARAETFEKIRRPAKWDVVMRNLEHMAAMRRDGILRRLCLNFVVQRDNFREILDFIALGDRLGADYLWLQRLSSYGTYDEATFAALDVSTPTHPDHAELLEILRHPALKREGLQAYMFMPLLPEVVASDEPVPYLTRTQKDFGNAAASIWQA